MIPSEYRTFHRQLLELLVLPRGTLKVFMSWTPGEPPVVRARHFRYLPDGRVLKDSRGANVIYTSTYRVEPRPHHFTF